MGIRRVRTKGQAHSFCAVAPFEIAGAFRVVLRFAVDWDHVGLDAAIH
jgi:hypothetical protein